MNLKIYLITDPENKKNNKVNNLIIKNFKKNKISFSKLDKYDFIKAKELIENSDLVIADATNSSTTIGGQIVYSLTKKIPTLALIYKDNLDTISPMLKSNPSDNLFIEHYDEDNLNIKITEFCKYIQKIKKRKGKLIVIDGTDGSGKATQCELIIKYLKSKKIPVKYFDFPRYYSSFFGETVAKFLRGEFGNLKQVSPYLASMAYAQDRAAAREEMEIFLKKGGVIIANRYATSNLGHQMAKFENSKDKKDFYDWIYTLEYKVNKIPRENLVIYLHVPYKIAYELTLKKNKRNYINGGKVDIHEKDLNYKKNVEETFLDLAKKNSHWKKIDCIVNDKLQTIEEINKIIIEEINKVIV